MDFENAVKIVRVSTQGRQNADWWVKSYILSYGLDGIFFEEYQVNGKVEVRTSKYICVFSRVFLFGIFSFFSFYILITSDSNKS